MGFKTLTALSLPALVASLFPLCLIPSPSLAQELQRGLSKHELENFWLELYPDEWRMGTSAARGFVTIVD